MTNNDLDVLEGLARAAQYKLNVLEKAAFLPADQMIPPPPPSVDPAMMGGMNVPIMQPMGAMPAQVPGIAQLDSPGPTPAQAGAANQPDADDRKKKPRKKSVEERLDSIETLLTQLVQVLFGGLLPPGSGVPPVPGIPEAPPVAPPAVPIGAADSGVGAMGAPPADAAMGMQVQASDLQGVIEAAHRALENCRR